MAESLERDGAAVTHSRGKAAEALLFLLLWLLPAAFLSVFFVLPLGRIFALTFGAFIDQASSLQELWQAVRRPLGFTFYQAILSTLLTLLMGLPMAFVFGRYHFRGRRLLRVLSTLPFILPTVVVAAGFNALLGPRGWLNLLFMDWFNLSQPPILFLNTLSAILTAHVFYNLTIVLRVVGGAWENLDPRLEQAARTLGASEWRAFWEVTFPILRPSILAATLLVFLFDFSSFGVILLMGGPRFATLEVEIYIQALQLLNLPLAGVLSAIQLLCTLLITLAHHRLTGGQQVQLTPRLKGEGLRPARKWAEKLAVTALLITLTAFILSPLTALSVRSVTRLEANRGERGAVQTGLTLDYYRELFINRRQSLFYVPPVAAARNSLVYALETIALSLGLGLPAAYALNRGGSARRWLDALLMLPLGASAVTLGLGYVLTFNRPPLEVRSFPLLIPMAHSLVALPFVVRTLRPAISAIPPSLSQAARTLGAPPARAWLEVDLPILSRPLLAATVFSFTVSLGEFGATSLLARPEFPTLPIAIYRFLSQPGALNYGQAMAMATLLMLLCGICVFLIEKITV
ncbi:MAG TPA: iron ABC transporter permease [Anaerolinea thermolimosa]|uniref:Iron ABC transporter permease n=1 Tax=Anaerolinea thermolimosa TaxID=229919 RepID=A0A3D1JEA1_9CHLR|nr:iron ABC transporter permease [Anaerolinea thermolimosa]GAP07348.1 ABC-type Fe3+ transport system, permease component [Anaerolinea thermolimosa]HCE16909.1 iron ABC transporter permease [Anaerolinea thermolimosa]